MNILTKLLYFLFLVVLFPTSVFAQAAAAPNPKVQVATPQFKSTQTVKYKVISSEDNTWGYEILVDEVRYIRQLSIPGVQGNKGFDRKEQAVKAAELVVKKIRNNEMPPTISSKELSSIITPIK